MAQQYSLSIILKAIDQTMGPMNALKLRIDGLKSHFDKLKAPVSELPQGIDRASSAMGRFGRSVETVARHVSKMRENLASLNVPEMQARNAAHRADLRGQAMDVVMVGGMFAKPLKDVYDFKKAVMDVGITANLSTSEIADVEKRTKEWSRQTGQSLGSLMEGQKALIAAGMDDGIVKQIMPAIANVAGAYQASAVDVAKTAFTAFDTLKVPAGEMAKAFDSLANAGKMGNFELKDMARYLPEIAPGAQALGLTGMAAVDSLGAMLQISRKGAGTNEGAATNLYNFVSKALAPDSIKNFAKKNVDIYAVWQDAIKKGMNPLEAILEKIRVLTKGGDQKLLGELFQDQEVQKFIRAFVQNIPEYKRILEANRAAKGVVDADKAKYDASFPGQIDRALAAMGRLSTALGEALIPTVSMAATIFEKLADWAEFLNSSMPGVLPAVLGVVAGLAALKMALIGIRLAGALAKGGLLSLLAPLMWMLRKSGVVGDATKMRFRDPTNGHFMKYDPAIHGPLSNYKVGPDGMAVPLTAGEKAAKGAKGGLVGAVKDALGGGLGAEADKIKKASLGARLKSLLPNAGKMARVAAPLAILGGLFSFGSSALEGDGQGMSEAVGSTAGGLGGGALGAAIGTAILPGIGTIIGGALGGWLGSEGGSAITGSIYQAWSNRADKPSITGSERGPTKLAEEMAAWARGEKPAAKGEITVKVEGPPGTTASVTGSSGDLNLLAKSGISTALAFG